MLTSSCEEYLFAVLCLLISTTETKIFSSVQSNLVEKHNFVFEEIDRFDVPTHQYCNVICVGNPTCDAYTFQTQSCIIKRKTGENGPNIIESKNSMTFLINRSNQPQTTSTLTVTQSTSITTKIPTIEATNSYISSTISMESNDEDTNNNEDGATEMTPMEIQDILSSTESSNDSQFSSLKMTITQSKDSDQFATSNDQSTVDITTELSLTSDASDSETTMSILRTSATSQKLSAEQSTSQSEESSMIPTTSTNTVSSSPEIISSTFSEDLTLLTNATTSEVEVTSSFPPSLTTSTTPETTLATAPTTDTVIMADNTTSESSIADSISIISTTISSEETSVVATLPTTSLSTTQNTQSSTSSASTERQMAPAAAATRTTTALTTTQTTTTTESTTQSTSSTSPTTSTTSPTTSTTSPTTSTTSPTTSTTSLMTSTTSPTTQTTSTTSLTTQTTSTTSPTTSTTSPTTSTTSLMTSTTSPTTQTTSTTSPTTQTTSTTSPTTQTTSTTSPTTQTTSTTSPTTQTTSTTKSMTSTTLTTSTTKSTTTTSPSNCLPFEIGWKSNYTMIAADYYNFGPASSCTYIFFTNDFQICCGDFFDIYCNPLNQALTPPLGNTDILAAFNDDKSMILITGNSYWTYYTFTENGSFITGVQNKKFVAAFPPEISDAIFATTIEKTSIIKTQSGIFKCYNADSMLNDKQNKTVDDHSGDGDCKNNSALNTTAAYNTVAWIVVDDKTMYLNFNDGSTLQCTLPLNQS